MEHMVRFVIIGWKIPTIKDNTADIKMKVWLFDPTEMDTADTKDTDDYIFEFSSNWEELEKNTINVNVNKKITISPKSKSDDFKNELKRFGKYNLWKFG